MTMAVRIHETGEPDVLKWEQTDVPAPGAGEALIRQTAVGLNYLDIYFRSGLNPPPPLPAILGMEAAGVVESVGDGVTDLSPGDRVAYNMVMGAYAEQRTIPAARLVKLPDGISDKLAASIMLKGTTAQYLLRRTYEVKPGETILFHAAAGGVGLIACQWAKHLGATVIGTVGSEEKAELAKAHGCDHPIIYTRDDFVEKVKDITGGEGVSVVYDSVGQDTFMGSLDCLKPRGFMVLFGQSSGPVEPFAPLVLVAKGSLYLTRPSLANYTATRQELVETCDDLFKVVESGAVKVQVNQTYALKDTAQAHRDLAARKTTGSTVLLP